MKNEKAATFLKKCIEYYSPSGKEKEYSEFLGRFLEKSNFSVKFDEVGNLIAHKGEGKPIILLVSHMDTIPGLLPVIIKEGKIFGRGAVDCKASLAAMVFSIANFNFQEIKKGKIIFAGIVREEDSLIGIEEFLKQDIEPDYAIFGEPTNINQICIGYKGRIAINIKIFTKAGHVASSWQYSNSIEIAFEIWQIIKDICNNLNKELIQDVKGQQNYYQMVIPTISVISGGTLTNVVPSESTIKVDIRFPPGVSSQKILLNIRNDILKFKDSYIKKEDKDFKFEEEITSQIEGFEIEGNELIVGAMRWAIFNKLNQKPIIIKKTGTTFINQIGIQYKIPSITYGPGNPKLEHTDDEYIEIEDYFNAIEIYAKFISKLFDNYHKKNIRT